MVVDDMANMPPRKRQSESLHPSIRPAVLPIPAIKAMTRQALTMGFTPIFTIFLKENSSPRLNIRKMTPMELHVSMLAVSLTVGV